MKINYFLPDKYEFTERLMSIAVKPERLYSYDKLPDLEDWKGLKRVAIVGSRRYSDYGEVVAYRAAYELARQGVVIVSGLAYGIDSIAHRGALDAGGRTVAVLGTPINRIYPTAHIGLAKEIVKKGGMVLSEYGPDAEFYPKVSFLERNRLISGLADVVLIVEAGSRSGTLNTAMHALDQGKELWVVPGNIDRLNSVGCNRLLNQGAEAYTGPEELLDFLFPKREKPKVNKIRGDNKEEEMILKLIAEGVNDGEEIVMRLKMEVTTFSQNITMLEIKGVVRALGMNRWAII